MVLLKNDNQILPILGDATIALIGHLATAVSLGGGGSARVHSLHAVTPLEAFKELGTQHSFVPGVPVFGALTHASPNVVSGTGAGADPRPVKLEWFNGPEIGQGLAHAEKIQQAEYMIKEAWPTYLNTDYCSRMTINITPETSGSHTFSVISTGVSVVYINDNKIFTRQQETDLVKDSFYFFKKQLERRFTHQMTAGETYKVVLDSWATDPKLLFSEPLNGRMFQGSSLLFFEFVNIPERISTAALTAARHDYAIVFVGNTNEIESEGYDRDSMDLPGEQESLIRAVAASNSRTIVVNFSGSSVKMVDFVEYVPAIVQAWFPGQECGHSIARLLLGKVNPSGCLPFSWPRKLEDNPSYGNFPADRNDLLLYKEGLDVGYRYYDRKETPEPLFPFGFGLSYTSFELSQISSSSAAMFSGSSWSVEISCNSTNTGPRPGKLVVQFYVEFPDTQIGRRRPIKELKAFSKVDLAAEETKRVKVTLDKYAVSFYHADHACWLANSGEYIVHVALSATNIVGQTAIRVLKSFTWKGL